MGKIRKEKRYRLHQKTCDVPSRTRKGSDPPAPPVPPPEVVPLPEDIMRSRAVVSLVTKNTTGKREVGRGKKEKLKMKREQWLQKIELSMEMRKEEKAAVERKATVVVGDLQPLVNSLPPIPASSSRERAEQSKGTRKTVLSEVAHYHDVLKHPAFKQDPMATILEHVQNSIATGVM